jgi:flagellar basal-body rod protein FlgC
MKVGDMFSAIDVSASGLALQRRKMDAIASNLANIDSVGPDGKPYQREEVQAIPGKSISFSQELGNQFIPLKTSEPGQMQFPVQEFAAPDLTVNEVAGRAVQDPTAVKTVYDPSNPNADANGYVREPNINVVTEMVDMITTTRSYQANVTAIQASKNIIKDAIDI